MGFVIYRRKYAKSKNQPLKGQHALTVINRGPTNDDNGVYEEITVDPGQNEVFINDVIESNLGKYSFELSNLNQLMDEKRADGNKLFLEEFRDKIKTTVAQCSKACSVSELPANQKKNRFNSIVPNDNSRVILKKQSTNQFSDYINASYIDGNGIPHKFIATQGPLPGTISDFWRMIWEQRCCCIAMLTDIVEMNKVKCAQYWPAQVGTTEVHGDTGVTCKETASYGDYVKRKMEISRDGEKRIVFQFHLISWLDHGIPDTTSSILRFHKAVVCSYSQRAGPIVVHCCSGADRTGTFIAFDILSQKLNETGNVNICALVARMRVRRPEMVRTLDQYIFLHKLVLELYQLGETDVDVSGFKEANQEQKRQRNKIAQEFGMLDYFSPLKVSMDIAQKSCNTHLNRDLSILPYDHNLAFIQMIPSDKTVPYLNASEIHSYYHDYKFVVTQSPDETSVEMFWRVAIDNDVSMIVNLREQKESNYCYWPKLSEEISYGSVLVRTLEETTDAGLTERKFQVKNNMKEMNMSHIVYCNWAEHVQPASAEIVLEIITKVEKHRRSISHLKKTVTLVHCSDGAGRSGAFCAISNLIDRVKNENRIDVFRTVKDLRDQRTMMVSTERQYKFCFQSVNEFLKSFQHYENFR